MITHIRALNKQELGEASQLVRRVFEGFESPQNPAQGLDTFHRLTSPEVLGEQLHNGQIELWGAYCDQRLVGVLGARDTNHIKLLFVEAEYHRRGIARALFRHFRMRVPLSAGHITVNSSHYAVTAYRHLGFRPTGPEQLLDGIRFTPMQYLF